MQSLELRTEDEIQTVIAQLSIALGVLQGMVTGVKMLVTVEVSDAVVLTSITPDWCSFAEALLKEVPRDAQERLGVDPNGWVVG